MLSSFQSAPGRRVHENIDPSQNIILQLWDSLPQNPCLVDGPGLSGEAPLCISRNRSIVRGIESSLPSACRHASSGLGFVNGLPSS